MRLAGNKREGLSMNFKILDDTIVLPLPSESLLSEKERNWRLKLPAGYRRFIAQYNGCAVEKNHFDYHHQSDRLVRFLCIVKDVADHDSGWSDISVVESQIGERLTANEDLVGIEVLPIAELSMGDYLCFDYRIDKAHPTVCVWSNEESGDFNPVTYFVAETFERFLDLLY